jgi:hypothetical protein
MRSAFYFVSPGSEIPEAEADEQAIDGARPDPLPLGSDVARVALLATASASTSSRGLLTETDLVGQTSITWRSFFKCKFHRGKKSFLYSYNTC